MMQELANYLKVDGQTVRVVDRSGTGPSSFWVKLRELAPWLRVETVHVPGLRARELELFGSRPHGSITFIGDVELPQLEPLTQGLRALCTGDPEWETTDTKQQLQQLDRPVELEVFVSPLCPFCATVAAAALRFAASSSSVSVRIHRCDAARLPEGVHTLPTVLADGAVVARGAIDEYNLVRQVFVYQRSVPPSSGVHYTPPSLRGQAITSGASARPGPAPSRRPRRSTAA
jgi:hypothetical protein